MARTPTNKNTVLPLAANGPGQWLMVTTLALLAVGTVMVHSAVASVVEPGKWYARVDYRHTVFAILAAVVLVTLWRANYKFFDWGKRLPWPAAAMLVLALVLGALVYVPGIGHSVGGYHRWIRIGPRQYSIGFQPSELIKFALIVFLAAWLSRRGKNIRSFHKTLIPAVLIILACVGMVITEDFGTAVLIAIAGGVTLLLAGVPWYQLGALVITGGGAGCALIMSSPRRVARFTALMDPWSLDNPASYQARQSIIAIASGGWFGRGIGQGTSKLGYLPEDSTDFIFSVFCEEWGFCGAILLMGLVVVWIWQARRASLQGRKSAEGFATLLAGSLGFIIALQAVLHIAVDVVVAPPTGMSFPFVSAGGTALLTFAAATAMIISVSSRPEAEQGSLLQANTP